MGHTSVGVIGSGYPIRFHHMQARVWTVAALLGLLTGCLETASIFSEAPKNARLVIRDDDPQKDPSDLPPGSSPPGPAAPLPEASPSASYSDDYWADLAVLDMTALRSAARSDPEIGLAEGMALLTTGEHAKAESAFVAMSRQASDLNVAIAAQIMLATTLLYEHKWTTLRDLKTSSTLGPFDRENTAELEQWGHAFAGVDEQTTTLPEKPIALELRVSPTGTPMVRVRVNGKEYEFWLDTGSSMTVLSSTIASDANVPVISPDTLTIRTFEGTASVRPAVVKRLQLGSIVFANTPTIIMDAALMRVKSTAEGVTGQGVRVDGIIGWDIIRQLDIVMDFQDETITLGRPEHLGIIGTEFQNLTWVGKPLVQVRTNPGGTFRFSLDTGAQISLLNGSILEKVGVVTRTYGGRVFGLAKTGGHTTRIVPTLTLDVGGRSLRLEDVIVYGPAYSSLINCDGILGSDIAHFGKIRIDATNGLFSVGG
jgi:hypothetical protein